ncbi:sigma-70 family RNA polymerase sigma factor [Isosphaeraceae bacterium EP7]
MDERSLSRTSASLLERLRGEAANPVDWAVFVGRYGPLIYGWCRGLKLQEADAQDVTQDVLTRLVSRLRSFRYDPSQSFRAYTRTLTHYAWCDFVESRRRPGARGNGDCRFLNQLDHVVARDDLQTQLSDAFDREVLEMAMERVKNRVETRTWEAFRLTAMEGFAGTQAAEKAGMGVAAAFKAKSKVQQMLREEVRRIEQDMAAL